MTADTPTPITNFVKADELAAMKAHESNLARCYMHVRRELAQADEVIRECEELLRKVEITFMGGHWLASRRHLWDRVAAYRESKHDWR